jgi:hypothetical protein
MPTGLLHAGEDISEAVEREVLEETVRGCGRWLGEEGKKAGTRLHGRALISTILVVAHLQGVKAKFDSVLLIRHAHGFAFGKSDLFVLCALHWQQDPGQGYEVTPQESEIEAACWLPLSEYTDQATFQAPLYAKISDR